MASTPFCRGRYHPPVVRQVLGCVGTAHSTGRVWAHVQSVAYGLRLQSLLLRCSAQMRQRELLFKHEKKTEKSQQTEHERPYLVLVVEKLNGQIDLTNKNIFIDGHLGNIVIEAYQVNRIGKKVAGPIERIKRGGDKK